MLKRETIVIFDSNGNLYLNKSKGEKISDYLFIFGMPILLTIVIFWLSPMVKPDLKLNFQIVLFSLLFCTYILVSYFNMVIKCLKNRNCVLSKRNGDVGVKKKSFCNHSDLVSVIIQPLVGSNGLGMSYTIGLESKKNSIPVPFFHGEKEAKKIASEVANFYNVGVVIKKHLNFSFFRKF
jgi:hypothetical protein